MKYSQKSTLFAKKMKETGLSFANISLILWSGLLIIMLQLLLTNPVCASPVISNTQIPDSITINARDSIGQLLSFNPEYLANAEIEHQKLLRNIFAVSFIMIFLLFIFTMFFYGGKIKKVSNVILLQDDALKSTKDQLIKIINIFNFVDQQVYITDAKGIVEWANAIALNYFNEDYIGQKVSLLLKYTSENQESIQKGINEQLNVDFKDPLYPKTLWKMIPIKNSKGQFSNMVFIC